MPETLTVAEQRTLTKSAARLEALRADSRRRIAEQQRNRKAVERRRANLLRSVSKTAQNA